LRILPRQMSDGSRRLPANVMKEFWLCFVPLFVAVDAIGVLPIFLSLTQGMAPRQLHRAIYQSVMTAAAVALGFLAVGTRLLLLLGITVADFMVAGGILLFVISMTNLVSIQEPRARMDPSTLGAVPLGVPLITGPAVLTTTILLYNQNGLPPTAFAILVNVLIAGVVFRYAENLHRVLGKAGSRTLSKTSHLLLASIAVMMVRKGIVQIVAQ
jgi:multiple antibiotic resistance protein